MGSGRACEIWQLIVVESHTLWQDDAEAIEQHGLSSVGLGDAAQSDFAMSSSGQDDVVRLDEPEFFEDGAWGIWGQLSIATRRFDRNAGVKIKDREFVPGDYTTISVTDTGTGMSPEVLEHIFEPFYTTKDRDKGTGLGLSMAFGFIRQLSDVVMPGSLNGMELAEEVLVRWPSVKIVLTTVFPDARLLDVVESKRLGLIVSLIAKMHSHASVLES